MHLIKAVSMLSRAGFLIALLLAMMSAAEAVPSFKRQTNLECTACHFSWLELTTVGRKFKLNGYTLGDRQPLPVAGMIQLSRTTTKSFGDQPRESFPHDGDVVLQQASVFLAGKWTDNIGSFIQWTWDGVENHAAMDNADIRYANSFGEKGKETVFGFTLHNNPTVQDVYNTTPAFGFPYASSSIAVAPNASTLIDGGLAQQVVGLGGYALWNDLVYAEVSAYRTANRVFGLFRTGQDLATSAALKGYNPYWRLALQHEWDSGKHSVMLGTFGFSVDKYPDPLMPFGLTDRFRDSAIDAQYQYVTDRHRVSFQASHIHERQNLNASFQLGASENPSNTLNTQRAKASYYFDNKYGVNVGVFSTRGSNDAMYNTGDPITGSANASPNSRGYVVELNWLPLTDIRLVAQYTGYNRFNGANSNYDGLGRNARDNNTLYLLGWFMF